ncbi:hypothetical protein cand_037750 [Cryptosporidium andersoni]|uniref:Uncharacterized protein n=1 Tax=Cryptosporidium andersoni TaxID=117008 RepID=A0A1J4MV85_9CRYT|nr:hypothetical protein cand_037750 [Cryptosporidium andersoni]
MSLRLKFLALLGTIICIGNSVHGVLFDQAKTSWIFSRQADTWLSKVKSYSTFVVAKEANSTDISELFASYEVADNETIKKYFGDTADFVYEYFLNGYGLDIKKLRYLSLDNNSTNTTFFWPDDANKWAQVSFVKSEEVTNPNFTITTFNSPDYLKSVQEVSVRFEVLESDKFIWGGQYLCNELVQSQLSNETPRSPIIPSPHTNLNLYAKQGQQLWYGYLLSTMNNETSIIGTFASSAPENVNTVLKQYIFSRSFAFQTPFLKKQKYPELGQYDSITSLVAISDIRDKNTYLKTGILSSPARPGLLIPSYKTGSNDAYPSPVTPYNYKNPLGPVFTPSKKCYDFLYTI